MTGSAPDALHDLDQLLAEAERQPFSGWDFSWLHSSGRWSVDPLPWDYAQLVAERAAQADTLLDMGTGGGERLAAMASRSRLTVATEAWPPNVPIAAQRLRPLGVRVIQTEAAPNNDVQEPVEVRGRLPFRDETFDLVINRNESFRAIEVARVLSREGRFITEQVSAGLSADLHRLLDLPVPFVRSERDPWGLPLARAQVEETVEITVVGSGTAEAPHWFHDVGALVWFLKAVPWEVPSFSIETHRSRLAKLHERTRTDGPLRVSFPQMWLEAVKAA